MKNKLLFPFRMVQAGMEIYFFGWAVIPRHLHRMQVWSAPGTSMICSSWFDDHFLQAEKIDDIGAAGLSIVVPLTGLYAGKKSQLVALAEKNNLIAKNCPSESDWEFLKISFYNDPRNLPSFFEELKEVLGIPSFSRFRLVDTSP